MPKQTFHNLKPERQREILEVAYREFTLNDYQSASLSQIIKTLNLAKGSFYRYFSSKKELYFYLLECISASRFDTLRTRVGETTDLFELIQANWHDKIRYEQEHPLESGFLYRVMRERYNPEIGNLELELKRDIMKRVMKLLSGPYSGKVRNDISPDIIAYTIVQIQLGFYDFLALQHHDDLIENLGNGAYLSAIDRKAMEGIIAGFTALLKNGIISEKQHDQR